MVDEDLEKRLIGLSITKFPRDLGLVEVRQLIEHVARRVRANIPYSAIQKYDFEAYWDSEQNNKDEKSSDLRIKGVIYPGIETGLGYNFIIPSSDTKNSCFFQFAIDVQASLLDIEKYPKFPDQFFIDIRNAVLGYFAK